MLEEENDKNEVGWEERRKKRRKHYLHGSLSPLPGSFLSPWALGCAQTQQRSKKTPDKRSGFEFRGPESSALFYNQGNERQEKLVQDVRCQSC